MKGKVRTREKCPQCGKDFKIIEEIDISCPKCNTRPKTFYIWLYWPHEGNNKHRIARDRSGHILDSYKRAHRLLENIRKEIDDKTFSITDYLPSEVEQFKAGNLFPKWYDHKVAEGKAPSHLREIERYIRLYYKPYFGNLDVHGIRTYHIEDFLAQLPKKQSVKTKKNIMTMLKNFCYWLFRRELLLRMPQFPVLSPPVQPIHWITKEDQLKALDLVSERHRPIFEFLIYHPVRIGEACALKVKDVNPQTGAAYICSGFSRKELRPRKNKKPYYLPLSSAFDVSLLRDKHPEAFVFTKMRTGTPYYTDDLRKIWHAALKKGGLKHISLYNATRHSIASQARSRGVDLATISEALGHSTVEMTKRYASVDIQRLKVVIDGGTQGKVINLRKNVVQ